MGIIPARIFSEIAQMEKDLNQCKGCACFADESDGGLVNGLCLDCRNPERTPQQEKELEIMRSRGEL